MQRFAPAGLMALGCLMSVATPSAAADVTLYGRVDLDAEIQRARRAPPRRRPTTPHAGACAARKTWATA